MLVIRRSQMQQLAREMERAFTQRLERVVASSFPEFAENETDTVNARAAAIRDSIEQAEQFGIERESDVAGFVLLSIAATMDLEPAAKLIDAVAASEDITGAAKMPLIRHRLEKDAAANPAAARLLDILGGVSS